MIERHVDGCVIGYDAQLWQIRTARTRRTRSVTGKISAILLAVSGEPELSMTEVARQARLPVSTTHRLLSGLVEGHVLDRGKDGRYSICVALRSPVGSTEGAAKARSQISLVLEDVGLATGLRARFGVWNGLGVSYLERSPGSRHGSCRSGLRVLPAHATALGKAMLAHAPAARGRDGPRARIARVRTAHPDDGRAVASGVGEHSGEEAIRVAWGIS